MTALCTTPDCTYAAVIEYSKEPEKAKVEEDFARYINAKRENKKDQKKSGKDHPVMCTLINRPCIHADSHLADTGVYENCRLCDVYQEVVHPPQIKIWK